MGVVVIRYLEVDSLPQSPGRLRREDSIRGGVVYTPSLHGVTMATAKTGSFYLTETIAIPASSANGTRFQGSIDLGAYVNVATGQAVAVHSVDFIIQRDSDYGGAVSNFLAGNGSISTQLTDLNPGTALVRADDQSLIASGVLSIDQVNNIASHNTDLFPDNFGPAALSEAYMVVNDTMYLVSGPDKANVGSGILYVTARIRASIVKLGSKDWMAIAIQSTASDN